MINHKLQIGHERKSGLANLQGRVYPTHLWVKFGSHTLSVIDDGSDKV
jgi:hypothetical protein